MQLAKNNVHCCLMSTISCRSNCIVARGKMIESPLFQNGTLMQKNHQYNDVLSVNTIAFLLRYSFAFYSDTAMDFMFKPLCSYAGTWYIHVLTVSIGFLSKSCILNKPLNGDQLSHWVYKTHMDVVSSGKCLFIKNRENNKSSWPNWF